MNKLLNIELRNDSLKRKMFGQAWKGQWWRWKVDNWEKSTLMKNAFGPLPFGTSSPKRSKELHKAKKSIA